jgi:DNA polymerase-1
MFTQSVDIPGLSWSLVESPEDLPSVPETAKLLFMDFETTSFSDEKEGFSPYNGARICGIAVTWDDHPVAYYVPVRHRASLFARANLPLEVVQAWMQTLPKHAPWVNHNVKFDAHFAAADNYHHEGPLVCTLTLAKIVESDRMVYDLKTLAKLWCRLPMSEVDEVSAYLRGIRTGKKRGSKDYGRVPPDILGKYAAKDVLSNRILYRYLLDNAPRQTDVVWREEIKLTRALYEMERVGMQGKRRQVLTESMEVSTKLIELHTKLAELTGAEYVDSNAHLFDILCNARGLPVLGYTEEDRAPSFDKEAMQGYRTLPMVLRDPELVELLDLIAEERKLSHYNSLFLVPYLTLMDSDEVLHPSFNQIIRTGRMSCRNPNAQQLNKSAKRLIHPPNGHVVLSADASQIEFRIIAHYVRDPALIDAYNTNPETDAHQYTADLAGATRPAGKTLNFTIGYGAGKKKVVSQLKKVPDLMQEIGRRVVKMVEDGEIPEGRAELVFSRLVEERAAMIYDTYHRNLPGLKAVSNKAANNCKSRGFVFNTFGRRRHLPVKACYRAFNTAVQGGAMDYIKSRMNTLHEFYNPRMRAWGCKMFVNVHDEIGWYVPLETMDDQWFLPYLNAALCHQPVPFRVPFLWDMGFSPNDWAEACGDDEKRDEDGTLLAGPLDMKAIRSLSARLPDAMRDEDVFSTFDIPPLS